MTGTRAWRRDVVATRLVPSGEALVRIDLVGPDAQAHWESVQGDINHLDYKVYRSYADKRVCAGPFTGMELVAEPRWHDGNLCLKLSGRYERELWDVIEKAISRQPQSVLNIGCCEGYYAVGLARRLPQAGVYACDIALEAMRLTSEAAALNGVSDRVVAFVTDRGVGITPEPPCLVVIDNEGAEEDAVASLLALNGDFIIECHDFLNSGVSERIAALLAATHEIERIDPALDAEFIAAQQTMFLGMIFTEKRAKQTCWLACWRKPV